MKCSLFFLLPECLKNPYSKVQRLCPVLRLKKISCHQDFEKLSENIKRKVFEIEEKQREMSLENIAHIIMSGQIKVYLNRDEEYQIYGRTKDIYKDLQNLGFSLSENNYTLKKEDFERIFPNEVKEFINEYSNKKSNKTQQEEQQEENADEEEYEEEYK